jgi:hypothetical protein
MNTKEQCNHINIRGVNKGLRMCTIKKCIDGFCKKHSNNKKDTVIEHTIQPKKSKLLSLPYEVLEKIIYKPRINKELQLIFNKNIPTLFTNFINTTKNINVIKLHIINEEEKDDDRFMKKYIKKNIDTLFNDIIKTKSIKQLNELLNKYKLYNYMFSKNYIVQENNVRDDITEIEWDYIFIWRFVGNKHIDSIIRNFIEILNKNFKNIDMSVLKKENDIEEKISDFVVVRTPYIIEQKINKYTIDRYIDIEIKKYISTKKSFKRFIEFFKKTDCCGDIILTDIEYYVDFKSKDTEKILIQIFKFLVESKIDEDEDDDEDEDEDYMLYYDEDNYDIQNGLYKQLKK